MRSRFSETNKHTRIRFWFIYTFILANFIEVPPTLNFLTLIFLRLGFYFIRKDEPYRTDSRFSVQSDPSVDQ